MSLEFGVATNIKAVQKRFKELDQKILPKVKSIAAERAAQHAARVAADSGQKALDDPIKAIFNGKKSRNRLGWIYMEWDERADIKRQRGNVQASIQLQGQGSPQARKEQQEALHRNIFGTSERKGVTPATPFIIRPSRQLLKQKAIRGVPFIKIDKFGNLRNYRKNLDKALNDPKKRFFQVKIGERGGGGVNGNGIKLQPGLYFRKLRVRKYKRNKHTRRKGGPYGSSKTRETVKIITILTYRRVRDFKRKWKFREDTQVAMRRKYRDEFIRLLNGELLKNRQPSRTVSTGLL